MHFIGYIPSPDNLSTYISNIFLSKRSHMAVFSSSSSSELWAILMKGLSNTVRLSFYESATFTNKELCPRQAKRSLELA